MRTPTSASFLVRAAQLADSLPTQLRLRRTMRGPAACSREGVRFVEFANCVIRVRQAGTHGPSLVLATDPPIPLELYDDLVARLADRYRITLFELPGFGCSLPKLGFQLSMPASIAAVTALLDQLPSAPHILGLPCVAGYIAMAVANARPDLVNNLILIQTPTWDDGQHWLDGRDPKCLLRRPLFGQVALATLKRRRIRQWYRTALADHSRLDEFVTATLTNFDHGGCFCLASGFQDFLRFHHDRVQPVAQDALIVWGRRDPSHARTDMTRSILLAPNAQSVWLDQAGHFPELEASAAFVDAVDQFAQRERAT